MAVQFQVSEENLMKSRWVVCCFVMISTLVNAEENYTRLPPGRISSPYEACKDVVIVSKDKYQENEKEWKNWEAKCQKVQVADEAGLTRMGSLEEGTQYLNAALKVTEKIKANIERSQAYALCSSQCFRGANHCDANPKTGEKVVKCEDRQKEVLGALKNQSKKLREALSLSREANSTPTISVGNVLAFNDENRFNKDLKSFEMGTPNPVGGAPLQPDELAHAKEVIKNERAQVDLDYKKMLAEGIVKDSPSFEGAWKSKVLMDRIDKRKEDEQLKYRQIVYEELPIFSVIDNPGKFQNGNEPVWTNRQIYEAFVKLGKNAEKTKAVIDATVKNGKLEFNRNYGQAALKWLISSVPGVNDRNDLLYYLGMKNQVEEVLKDDKSLCGAVTTMSQRLASKEIQNAGIVFASSFAGGSVTRASSKGIVWAFRVGRALSGAEASSLSGLALASTYLGDSFRHYNTAVAEVTSGVRDFETISNARTNAITNLVFAPFAGASGWRFGKNLYNSLGKKMAKDLPEIAELMKKAGSNRAMRDEVVDKWLLAKVKEAFKNKLIDSDEEALFRSKAGGEVFDTLAEEILKKNPDFFKEPSNFDFFLKLAATKIKPRAGDPKDLEVKARDLLMGFNFDAVEKWDSKARSGLMKVYNEGIEELRAAYAKDPAVYATFNSNGDSQGKIIGLALKRAGVPAEEEAAYRSCLRK